MQGACHCVQLAFLVIPVWILDIRKEDSATLLALQLHKFLIVFPVSRRLVERVFDKVLLSHVVAVEIERYQDIDTGGI